SSDIDLILMDINLGSGIDGTQAAELILQNHDIPVVFLSSHTEPEVVEKTEKITSYGYVVKNSSTTVLDASIKMAFKLFDAMVNEQIKEESLRQSVHTYKTLFNEMLDGFALHEIICDSSGEPVDYRFLDVNPAFERMTGLRATEILGRTVLKVLPETE
ncbi:MAG: response regulator, partial [Spirochaetia bacterium]